MCINENVHYLLFTVLLFTPLREYRNIISFRQLVKYHKKQLVIVTCSLESFNKLEVIRTNYVKIQTSITAGKTWV